MNFGTTNREAEKFASCVLMLFACLAHLPHHDVDAGAGRDRLTGRVDLKLVEVHRSSGTLALAPAEIIERRRSRT